jgi:sporadic carbohydrate cluster protein (TIGR04323 family)
MKKRLQGYIFSRSFLDERVPQHVQNLVIRDYCERKGCIYLLSATEYAMEHCHLMLKNILNDLESIDGIVAYSLFQLPEDTNERQNIYSKVLANKKSLHFAVEGLEIKSESDKEHIESIWQIRKILPLCAKNTK